MMKRFLLLLLLLGATDSAFPQAVKTFRNYTELLDIDATTWLGVTAGQPYALKLQSGKYQAQLLSPVTTTGAFADLASKPTTIAGFGITDFNSLGDARWAALSHSHTFASLTSKPTTIAGYGITDAFTQAAADLLYRPIGYVPTFASITSKPTTIAGYGITDAFSGAFSALTGKPTTISGYGITDAFTQSAADLLYRPISYVPTFASITSKPTTISGYGITDASSKTKVTNAVGVFVSDYGAVGNGTTDDTAAWQAAIDAAPDGATIWGDATSNYKITSSLLINNRKMLTLKTQSTAVNSNPRFTWAGASGGTLLKIYDSYGCTIEGFAFHTTSGINCNKFIDIDTVSGYNSYHTISHCYLNNSLQDNPNFIGISIDASGSVANENMHVEDTIILGSPGVALVIGEDGVMTAGSPILTSATANFPTTIVGKVIRVGKVGTGITTLKTTCLSRQSATQITLADNAVLSATGARIHSGNSNGIGIFVGSNPNAKHEILRNIQLSQCDIGIKNISGSVEIYNFGSGYSGTGLYNTGNTEPIIVEQMVTEGNLVEIDQPGVSSRLQIRNCRGANDQQLTEGFYKLDGRVLWEQSETGGPPIGGRIIRSYGTGNLELIMLQVKLAIASSGLPIPLSASGFDTLASADTLTTMGATNVAGWPRTLTVKRGFGNSNQYNMVATTNHNMVVAGSVAESPFDNPSYRLEAVSGINTRKYGDDEIEIFGVPRPTLPAIEKLGTHGGAASYGFVLVAVDSIGNRSLRSYTSNVYNAADTLSSTNYLHLSWATVPYASTYEVYRTNPSTPENEGELLASGITGTTYDITSNPAAGPYTAYTSLLPAWNESTGIKFRARTINVNEVAFAAGAATPSIAKANDFVTANTGATSITNFTNGIDGQVIRVRVNDAFTTFTNNANISLRSGANLAATNGQIYSFMFRGGAWRQLDAAATTTTSLTGDATGSGTTSIPVTLANTGVAAGSYTNSNITVDSKGRVTGAANGTAGSGGTIATTASVLKGDNAGAAIAASEPADYHKLTVQTVGDANATISAGTDLVLITTALTGNRIYTVPAASGYVGNRRVLKFADVAGMGTNFAQVQRSGSDTINASASTINLLNASYSSSELYSDGTSAWRQQNQGSLRGTGAFVINAGGTNQDVSLNPTGTGFVTANRISLGGWWSANQNATGGISFGSAHRLVWGSSSTNTNNSDNISGDTGFSRNAAGVMEVNSGTAGIFRDLKLRTFIADSTTTASGTTGAQTINKSRGTVRFAAGASTLVVTDSLVAATSKLRAFPVGAFDATATNFTCTAAAGSFTVTANAAATAETEVGFDLFIP